MSRMAQKKRNTKSIKFGFIFWVMFILLVILLFFINRGNITSALHSIKQNKTTTANESLQTQIQAEVERINKANENKQDEIQITGTATETNTPTDKADTEKSTVEKNDTDKKKDMKKTTTDTTEKKDTNKTTEKQDDSAKIKTAKTDESKKQTKDKTTESTKTSTVKSDTAAETRTAMIYFVSIDTDGKINRVPVKRSLAVSDSPMSDALNSLFKGVNTSDGKALRSLIPENTKLLGATVRDGIAYINVSESFEFNQYGIEGYLAELAQVIYTVTEFPTVQSVQFLIEGQKKDYLGADGIWIGSPLSRESF